MTRPFRNPAVLSAFILAVAIVFYASPALHAQAPVTPENPDQKLMQSIEDRWSEAIVKHDQFGLENTLSPQFVDISADGEITTRNQQVARLFVKDVNVSELSQKVVSLRVFGETAVVTGTFSLRRRGPAGTTTEKGIFTHVFGRTRSGWLCLQSQRTAVVEEQAFGKRATKKSSASEPFHIPLFHKGAEPAPAAPAQTATPSSAIPPQPN